MTKRMPDMDNVLDLYPEEMQPSTNGHTAVEAVVEKFDEAGEVDWKATNRRQQDYEHLIETLNQPLDKRLVRQRKGHKDKTTGKAKMLDYLSHATVTRAMNRIFGYGKWSQQVVEIKDFFDDGTGGVPRAVRATVSVHVSAPGFDHFEPMAGTGYQAVQGNYWDSYEMALGNALAKAFKKACAQYGDQFGLSLYPEDEDSVADADDEGNEAPTPRKQASGDSPREYADNEAAECEECGKAIRGYTNRNGKTYTTQQLVDMSRKQANGRVLCLDCRH